MDTVIKVENLSKQYRLGQVGTGTLSHDINRFWYKIRGKEDPYLRIGDENNRTVKGDSEYVWALRDINFEVKHGEVLGIIGRNGAGKSTLLKILSKTTKPTTGNIKIKGRVASLLEVGTGFHPELNGRENIFLNGAILGMTKEEIRKKFDEIVDFAGVEKYIDTPVKRYSSGMYIRLAFGVAAHLEPEILIVDEVLAVGDLEFQKKALGKMKDVSNNEGRTVLFVSHNIMSLRQLCNKGILLINGTVNFSGDATTAINTYISSGNIYNLSTQYIKDQIKGKDFELIKARILDANEESKANFSIFEDIFFELTIICKRKVPGIYGYIAIKNKQHDVFIESDTFDYRPNVLDEIALGTTVYRLQINKNILPKGEFIVYVSFASQFANKFDVEVPGDILAFSVEDNETKRGGRRNASTSFLLEWKTIKN